VDRLLTWADLEPRDEHSESVTIPTELRDELRKRSDAFIRMTGETFDPLLVIEFSTYSDNMAARRCVVVRESDLHGTIGANVDNILTTCPDVRPDVLVRRGTL
jgi:hypothetical protein